jgi:CTP:phosphocholine cytidylyltransferase-like protein
VRVWAYDQRDPREKIVSSLYIVYIRAKNRQTFPKHVHLENIIVAHMSCKKVESSASLNEVAAVEQ